MQSTHDHYTPAQQHKEIVLVCEHILSPANQGALFRLADAFGIQELIFIGAAPDITSSRLKKTARSTQEYVSYSTTLESKDAVQAYKNKGFECVALEITQDSTPLSQLPITTQKLLLLIGNENQGISEELLQQADYTSHIKMYGHNSSMNVAQAAAIALYQLCEY